MYVIPLIVILLIALAIFLSPLLAVALFVLALAVLGAVKYFGGGSVVDPENAPTATRGQADVPEPSKSPARDEQTGGIWGETWPEEREGSP
jgi:hypothetical protein